MRRLLHEQLPLVAAVNHLKAMELAVISRILDQLPEINARVHETLWDAGAREKKGRETMTAEQVVRVMIVKQLYGFSYEELSFHLLDSASFRGFCRMGFCKDGFSKSALQRNIKCVPADVWERTNRLIVAKAHEWGLEKGKKLRTDCTVVETNIHEPRDSTLLWDCVRVLSRLLKRAQEVFGVTFVDHQRRARRRTLGILHAKRMEKRVPLYRDLIRVTELVMTDARSAVSHLDDLNSCLAREPANELRYYVSLAERVVNQTVRRVLRGESVPPSEKVVSIFETHTDIIVKDRRDTHYGHKVCLTTGASGLVIDLVVESGNPADSTLATKMVARARNVLGMVAQQVAFDGGFSSQQNVANIKALGAKDVAFSKHVGLEVQQMVRKVGSLKSLRHFRAGIEATISFLKRQFGWSRCTWRSLPGFKSYVWASTVAINLVVLARHLLSA
jgi:IS5 family transposase